MYKIGAKSVVTPIVSPSTDVTPAFKASDDIYVTSGFYANCTGYVWDYKIVDSAIMYKANLVCGETHVGGNGFIEVDEVELSEMILAPYHPEME